MMRKLLLCLLSFFLLTTTAQISTKNNFLQTKTARDFFQRQQIKKNESNRIVRSVQLSKTIHVTNAGTLDNLLTPIEKNTITDLTITGTLDARDFRILRDSLVHLAVLDLSTVTVVSYSGSGGTDYYDTVYPPNEIPEYAFYTSRESGTAISQLTSILLPSTVSSVGNLAFAFCSSLSSISISSSLSQIGQLAFLGCSAKINVDETNPNYSSVEGVLFDKEKTKLIQCPISITGNYNIPSTVQSVAPYGFCFCDKLSSVNIPSSVESIGIYAFTSFNGIFNIDSNNKNYSSEDNVLFNKSASLLIQCSTLRSGSYTIPSSVDSIGDNSFYNCSLITSLFIPSSVIAIADFAFYNCSGLTSITVNSKPLYLGLTNGVFNLVNTSTCILNVPFGTKSLYQSAAVWNSFTNIVENSHGLILGTNKSILSSAAGSTTGIKITTNDAWTAASNQSWLKVSPEIGTGNDTIFVTAEANPSPDNRIALVTVSAEGIQPQTITITQAGIPKSIDITAGKLATVLTAAELSTMINLKITGTIDARDFKTMRDNMPMLSFLDISEVNIAAYNGTLGTAGWISTYPANRIPDYAFNKNLSSLNLTLKTVKLPATINSIGDYAFYSCNALTEIIIPNSVTYIGSGSFGSCNKLETVILPIQLTAIENQAFTGCGFSEITIPNTVKTIGQSCFINCKNLRSINIPNSVTTISNSAFENCTALTGLTIGSSVTYIGNSAFGGCSALTDVVIPNSVMTLDGFVFGSCTNLKSVVLPNSLATIGYFSFYKCTNLTDITIPNSVTKIDYSAFSYCRSLTNLDIPNSVTFIGNSAFSYCIALTTLTIPGSVNSIESSAFDGCTGLTSIHVKRDVPLNFSNSTDVFNNVNKSTCILNVPFGSKALYAAANQWQDFTNIIEDYGFLLDKNTLNVGSTKGSIVTVNILSNEEWSALCDQSWLKVSPTTFTGNKTITFTAEANPSSSAIRIAKVTISANGVQSKTITITQAISPKAINITAGELYNSLATEELKNIMDLTVTGSIDARDFRIIRDSMPALRTLDLTQTRVLSYIGSQGTESIYSSYSYLANAIPQYAFYNGSYSSGKRTLVSIKLPSSTRSIGRESFNSCPVLTEVIIPDSVKLIDRNAFEYCRALTSIVIPKSVTALGQNAFYYCSGLTSVTLSDSLTTIAWDAFANCTSLTDIKFGKSINSISISAFYNCTSLKNIIIPNSVISIGSSSFSSCTGLTEVIIGDSVKEIGSSAFSSCISLTRITIPISVLKIGYSAFSGCSGLKLINTEATIPVDLSNSNNVFLNIDKTICALTVPFDSKKRYAVADQWKDFTIVNECTTGLKLDTDTARLTAKKGNTVNVSFTANTSWRFTSNATWLHLSQTSGTGSNFITLTADPNILLTSRRTTITILIDGAPTQVLSIVQDAAIKEVITIPGKLFSNLTTTERNIVSNMSVSGSIDARDFKFMRDSMPSLTNLDLKEVTINGYVGTEGTDSTGFATYLPNAIPQYAFCNDVTSIYNVNLKSIIFPESILSIGRVAFAECKKLESIKIPDLVQNIERSSFYGCIGLLDVSIPGSVKSIERTAFFGCSKLNGVIIPESVISVGDYAFRACAGLSSINLPESVTSIGLEAFAYCNNLNSIYAYQVKPVDLSLSLNVFISVNTSICLLYVPQGSKALYQAAVQWKDFTNIIEMPTTYTNLINGNIKIYPNPVKESFSISGLNEAARITLSDINGKQVLVRQVNAGEAIPVSDLAKGIYILRVVTAEGTLERKLIKE